MNPLWDQLESPDVVSYGKMVSEFFLKCRGRCFEGWDVSKISQYVTWHLLNGTLFAAHNAEGDVGLAVIAWLDDSLKIRALAGYEMPQFVWQELPKHGDSILIADVVGDRKWMPEILTLVNEKWPDVAAPLDIPRKRLFTYRRGRLVELSWETVMRFADGRRQSGSSALPFRFANQR